MERTAVGYFRGRRSADRAYAALIDRGFDPDDVSVMGRGREGATGLADDDHVGAAEGAAAGSIMGVLVGAAAMLIPGVGPIVAAGPVAAALAGAITGGVTGAVVGGVVGALVDAGLPEVDARYYDERFQTGGILVTVRADDALWRDAAVILQRHGADVRGTATLAGIGPIPGSPYTSAPMRGRDRTIV